MRGDYRRRSRCHMCSYRSTELSILSDVGDIRFASVIAFGEEERHKEIVLSLSCFLTDDCVLYNIINGSNDLSLTEANTTFGNPGPLNGPSVK